MEGEEEKTSATPRARGHETKRGRIGIEVPHSREGRGHNKRTGGGGRGRRGEERTRGNERQRQEEHKAAARQDKAANRQQKQRQNGKSE